jgi:hypothetical protein
MPDQHPGRDDAIVRDGAGNVVRIMPDPDYPPEVELGDYWDTIEIPHDPEARERWQVDGDRTAGWAMRKLAQVRAETARLTDLHAIDRAALTARFEESCAEQDAWLSDATAGAVEFAALLNGKLLDFQRRVAPEGEAMPRSYRVPGGTLTARRNPPSVDVDGAREKELVDWCLANDRRDLLDIKPSKAAIKAQVGLTLRAPGITVDGKGTALVPGEASPLVTADGLDEDTGEVLPGVTYRVGDERYAAVPEAVTP